ncbi:hypothetical protein [Halocatena halophila]|uniref:hypothetical protein n=1 Tax=Halocatena halophila TaxID=2814576 RepID=UPI002ED4795E
MSTEIRNNNDEDIDTKSARSISNEFIEVLKSQTSSLITVRQYGIVDEFMFKIEHKNKEEFDYLIETTLDNIRDAGFKITSVLYKKECIIVEPDDPFIVEI